MQHLNFAAALAVCLIDIAFIGAFPLVSLMFLPNLFAAVCWASCAWQALPPRRAAPLAQLGAPLAAPATLS